MKAKHCQPYIPNFTHYLGPCRTSVDLYFNTVRKKEVGIASVVSAVYLNKFSTGLLKQPLNDLRNYFICRLSSELAVKCSVKLLQLHLKDVVILGLPCV